MTPNIISQIKQASDCRELFRRFWPDHFREHGNCHCPWHDDGKGSLQISRDVAYCHACGYKYDQIDLYSKANSIPNKDAVSQLAKELNLNGHKPKSKIIATYDYKDVEGKLIYQSVRFEPKDFRQRRPDPAQPGKWIWNLTGVPRILYRLPELARATTVWITEGEKDADRLAALGLCSTTNSEGAGKWRPELSAFFVGKHVIILPDNDEVGRKHAGDVARKLLTAGAADVRIVYLPGLPEKGDVSDWLNAGGTVEQLIDLAAQVGVQIAGPACDPGEQLPSIGEVSLTEDGIALAFTQRYAGNLKYCHKLGSWFRWNGNIWEQDEVRLAFHWAREICREVNYCGKTNLSKAATASSVEKFAQADPKFAVLPEIWDQDIWILGTPSGTVDLRTGKLRKPSQGEFITKQTLVAPAADSIAPTWSQFLLDATRKDCGLIRFLQQMAGMCLTGSTREHALFFIYGGGGNGKGTFLNVMTKILNDYAKTAAMDTFISSKTEKHSTDLAMLRGARLVTASETESGKSWAEAKIKQLTGGDMVTARFMRQDNFTYLPQFKLVIIGNYEPILRNVDDAARRRFNIIPFIHKPEKKDLLLPEKLESEYPAILRWMIEGCLDWQENGLIRPHSVGEATENYFKEQDLFGRWIDERCEIGLYEGQFESSEFLFKSWSDFALLNGEKRKIGTITTFGTELSKRGFEKSQKKVFGRNTTVRIGISLIKTKENNHNPD